MKMLLYVAAICQLGILIAGALVPGALNWRKNLAGLHPFLRRLFWVYGSFIVLTVMAFSMLTFANAGAMAAGDPVARSLCLFIAVFWSARLFVQFAIFDAQPFLTNWIYKIGYHALTVVFVLLVAIYAMAAFRIGSARDSRARFGDSPNRILVNANVSGESPETARESRALPGQTRTATVCMSGANWRNTP